MRFSRPLYLSSYYVERPAVYTDKRKTFSKNWIFKFNRIFFFRFSSPNLLKRNLKVVTLFYFIVTIPPSSNNFLFRLKKEKNTAGLTSFFDYLKKTFSFYFPFFFFEREKITRVWPTSFDYQKNTFLLFPQCVLLLYIFLKETPLTHK
jgi:hypothetical protein